MILPNKRFEVWAYYSFLFFPSELEPRENRHKEPVEMKGSTLSTTYHPIIGTSLYLFFPPSRIPLACMYFLNGPPQVIICSSLSSQMMKKSIMSELP